MAMSHAMECATRSTALICMRITKGQQTNENGNCVQRHPINLQFRIIYFYFVISLLNENNLEIDRPAAFDVHFPLLPKRREQKLLKFFFFTKVRICASHLTA